ncbi:MAG: hypothetical protein LBD62_05075 [Candidatus Margulisbacteria bacterium]|jgi:hypothetical protein|nr:hypothetical protein [Candidatus Margulisiibacteriota bacterium]
MFSKEYFDDSARANEPKVLQEIHSIRLAIHNETQGMTTEEKRAYFHEGTIAFFARRGLTPNYAKITAKVK